MKGQLAGSIGAGEAPVVLVTQGVGDAAVKPFAFRREKLVVHDLTDQRVTKAVGVSVASTTTSCASIAAWSAASSRSSSTSATRDQEVVDGVVPDDGDDADDRPADDIEIFEFGGDEI